MSNHLHALLRTRGRNLALFMRDVKSAITSTINLLTGKSGTLWQRRYDAQAVVDCKPAHSYNSDWARLMRRILGRVTGAWRAATGACGSIR